MDFCSDSVGWVVNSDGNVYFTNRITYSLSNSYQETSLSDIKQIVVAEDRKAVYAIDNSGNVYRY